MPVTEKKEKIEKKTVGVNLGRSLTREVDKPLEYGDSRSERVRYLVRLGLEAERGMGEIQDDLDVDEQTKVIRQALIDYRNS